MNTFIISSKYVPGKGIDKEFSDISERRPKMRSRVPSGRSGHEKNFDQVSSLAKSLAHCNRNWLDSSASTMKLPVSARALEGVYKKT